MRNRKLLIALGIVAFLVLGVATGDKARMAYFFESAVRAVKGWFGA